MVFTVDATPDTGELEYNEIKTQVELATGRLGLRRTAREHSFPRMLHQVGFSTSRQPGSRPVEARSSASPRQTNRSKLPKETSSAGGWCVLASLHPSAGGHCFCSKRNFLGGGAWCDGSGPPVLLAIFPNPFHLERTGPLPPGKLLPWRTVSSDVSVSMGLGGETRRASQTLSPTF